jgi:alkyl sulfatase BDS1-like metallo-beta-lactamase superfamily hydrolase
MKSASVLLPAILLAACATTSPSPTQTAIAPAPPPSAAMSGPEKPSPFTRAEHDKVRAERAFSDMRDFDFAQRGFIATRKGKLITNAAGQTVWDLSAYDFLAAASSETVNPSLCTASSRCRRTSGRCAASTSPT